MTELDSWVSPTYLEGIWSIASDNDLDRLFDLYRECTIFLERSGFTHWRCVHSRERIKSYILDARTICFKGSGEMIGAVVLSTKAPFYHTLDFDAFWTRRENFAYVGRLAVRPKFHSQGIGKALLHMAELIWQRQGGTSLRLDLNRQADSLSSLYLNFGFKVVGAVGESILFEKVLG